MLREIWICFQFHFTRSRIFRPHPAVNFPSFFPPSKHRNESERRKENFPLFLFLHNSIITDFSAVNLLLFSSHLVRFREHHHRTLLCLPQQNDVTTTARFFKFSGFLGNLSCSVLLRNCLLGDRWRGKKKTENTFLTQSQQNFVAFRRWKIDGRAINLSRSFRN